MSASPLRGCALRDLSPNCRPTRDGGGWLGDSDSIIIALSEEDGAVASENVSLAPSLEAEIMRSTSCVPRPPTTSLSHPRSSPQAASTASLTPTRQRIVATPTSTPRLKTLAPIPSLRRVSTTPIALKAPQPTTPSSAQAQLEEEARRAQWEQRRIEERRRRDEESSVLDMLASVDRGNEEHKLARQSLLKVEDSSQNPPVTPLLDSPSDLGGESSMALHQPSAMVAFALSSPAPTKPREQTLSPQDRRNEERTERLSNNKNNDAHDDDHDVANGGPISDGNSSPVDVCVETLRVPNDVSTYDVNNSASSTTKYQDVTTPIRRTIPRPLPHPESVFPAALSRSPQRRVEASRGPLVSPQRPTRSLTPCEQIVAKDVSRSLSRQALRNNPHNSSSPSCPQSMKGCSITVSPLSSKAVSPIPTSITTVTEEGQAPLTIEAVIVPTTPQTSDKLTYSSVASGTPSLYVSTATQMTPQIIVAPAPLSSTPITSHHEAFNEEEVPSLAATLVKKEPSEEVEREIVDREGSAESNKNSQAVVVSKNTAVASSSAASSPIIKKEGVAQLLLPLGGAAAIGQKRSRDTSSSHSMASHKDNRSESRATTASKQRSSLMASEPEEEEEIIQPERKALSAKLKKIAAQKKAALSQSPVPRVTQGAAVASYQPERLSKKERKQQIAQEYRERLREEREAKQRRAGPSNSNNGQKKKKNNRK